MKLLQKILCLTAALALAGVAHGETAQQLLTQGQLAYQRGDYETAKRNLELVNRMDPRNPTAIGLLKMIQAQQKKGGGQTAEKALSALILPQLQFKEASLGSALDFLKKKAADLSGGKVAANFVVQPGIDQDNTRVTLNLSNIPFTEAVRYIGELANVTFEYQQYAIMVRPKAPLATNSPAPAPAGAPIPGLPNQ